MRKALPSEILVPFVVCMAGCSAMTLIASYYPDSDGYIYVCVLTVALQIVAAFFIDRAKKKAT